VTFLVVWLCVVCGCVISAVLFLPGGTVGYPAQPGLTWRNPRLPSPTRINLEEP
jgi:hypothetical protein